MISAGNRQMRQEGNNFGRSTMRKTIRAECNYFSLSTPRPISVAGMLFIVLVGTARSAQGDGVPREAVEVVEAFLRATHARDSIEAYKLISAEDRKVRDLDRYLRQRGDHRGFTLEAAKKLGEALKIEVLQGKSDGERAEMLVRYRAPDMVKLAPAVLDWDAYRLNSLGAVEQHEILDALAQKQRDGSLPMKEEKQRFVLLREANQWRVFLDWAAGVRIPLRLDLSKAKELEAALSMREAAVQPGEIFEILLKIKNNARRAVTVRVGHLVEPHGSANYLDFIQCGFLLPVTIPAQGEEEYSGVYLLRGNLPEGLRRMYVTYDFRILR